MFREHPLLGEKEMGEYKLLTPRHLVWLFTVIVLFSVVKIITNVRIHKCLFTLSFSINLILKYMGKLFPFLQTWNSLFNTPSLILYVPPWLPPIPNKINPDKHVWVEPQLRGRGHYSVRRRTRCLIPLVEVFRIKYGTKIRQFPCRFLRRM